MMPNLRFKLARRFPQLVRAKRFAQAFWAAHNPVRDSYSQLREDVNILDLLKGVELDKAFYLDIGANHPSLLSNTYRMYRLGARGVLLDPDEHTCRLLRRFRPGDTVIRGLAGDSFGLQRFYHNVSSFLSGTKNTGADNIVGEELVPQVTVDSILAMVDAPCIHLMSVDTEGNDLAVLRGAAEALRRTVILCVEWENGRASDELDSLLARNSFFLEVDNGLNRIYRNSAQIGITLAFSCSAAATASIGVEKEAQV